MDETPNSTNECFQSLIGEGAAGFVGQDSDKVHVPEGQIDNGAARRVTWETRSPLFPSSKLLLPTCWGGSLPSVGPRNRKIDVDPMRRKRQTHLAPQRTNEHLWTPHIVADSGARTSTIASPSQSRRLATARGSPSPACQFGMQADSQSAGVTDTR